MPPGEGLTASEEGDPEEPPSEVGANLSAGLSATDDEGEEGPEGEDPGGWDEPGDDSVVDLLHDSLVDVGEKPEEGGETEEDAVGDSGHIPGMLGSTGDDAGHTDLGAPDFLADSAWSDGSSEDTWEDGEEEPDKADSDG